MSADRDKYQIVSSRIGAGPRDGQLRRHLPLPVQEGGRAAQSVPWYWQSRELEHQHRRRRRTATTWWLRPTRRPTQRWWLCASDYDGTLGQRREAQRLPRRAVSDGTFVARADRSVSSLAARACGSSRHQDEARPRASPARRPRTHLQIDGTTLPNAGRPAVPVARHHCLPAAGLRRRHRQEGDARPFLAWAAVAEADRRPRAGDGRRLHGAEAAGGSCGAVAAADAGRGARPARRSSSRWPARWRCRSTSTNSSRRSGRCSAAHPNGLLEVANEPTHPSQAPAVGKPDVLLALGGARTGGRPRRARIDRGRRVALPGRTTPRGTHRATTSSMAGATSSASRRARRISRSSGSRS